MTVTGKINRINGKYADVSVARREECNGCRGCGFSGKGFKRLVVENTLAAKAGDFVSVELQEKNVPAASVIAYLVPVLALGGGLGLGIGLKLEDIFVFLTGTAFLVLGFLGTWLIDRALKKTGKYSPKMTELLPPGAAAAFTECSKTGG